MKRRWRVQTPPQHTNLHTCLLVTHTLALCLIFLSFVSCQTEDCLEKLARNSEMSQQQVGKCGSNMGHSPNIKGTREILTTLKNSENKKHNKKSERHSKIWETNLERPRSRALLRADTVDHTDQGDDAWVAVPSNPEGG